MAELVHDLRSDADTDELVQQLHVRFRRTARVRQGTARPVRSSAARSATSSRRSSGVTQVRDDLREKCADLETKLDFLEKRYAKHLGQDLEADEVSVEAEAEGEAGGGRREGGGQAGRRGAISDSKNKSISDFVKWRQESPPSSALHFNDHQSCNRRSSIPRVPVIPFILSSLRHQDFRIARGCSTFCRNRGMGPHRCNVASPTRASASLLKRACGTTVRRPAACDDVTSWSTDGLSSGTTSFVSTPTPLRISWRGSPCRKEPLTPSPSWSRGEGARRSESTLENLDGVGCSGVRHRAEAPGPAIQQREASARERLLIAPPLTLRMRERAWDSVLAD